MSPVSLSKDDARKAFVAFHFRQDGLLETINRLGSVQFDPLSPVGCNHDLVLQARVPHYKVGDWKAFAYRDRVIYDGWDKQACLVPFSGWPLRRIFHEIHREWFDRIFQSNPKAIEAVLSELETKGPLMPRDFHFQEHKPEWKGSWFGPNLTKQTLRALWHSGKIMTTNRSGNQHVYDLTERVVPAVHLHQPRLEFEDAIAQLILERHRAVGLLQPTASYEVWSLQNQSTAKRGAISRYVDSGDLIQVDVEGVSFHAVPNFFEFLHTKVKKKVTFIAPLDQFVWDRKAILHLFGYQYLWEVYVPESKRKWGYYVLPVLYGDRLVARIEFYCRHSILEIRNWHIEPGFQYTSNFVDEFKRAMQKFMKYAGATEVKFAECIDRQLQEVLSA